ncbi:MAG: ABC transporter ATP-binding protein [Clostridia bacterium]
MQKPLKWIIKNTKFMFFPLLFLIFICVAISICSIAFALKSGEIINSVTSGSGDLVSQGVAFGLIIALEILLRVINSRISVSFGGRLEMHFREKVFRTLSEKKWIELNKYHTGELVNRIRQDSSVITNGVMHILPNGTMFLTRVILAIVALFSIDRQFTVILCSVSLVLLGFGRIYSKKMKYFHKEVQKSEGTNLSFMLESLQNIVVLKAFGGEKSAVKSLKKLHKETLTLRLKRNLWNIAASVSMIVLFTGGFAFTILWGAYRLSQGALLFGDFTAMVQLINQVQSPFKSMGSLLVTYQNMLASAERLLELEELSSDIKDTKAIPKDFDFSSLVFSSVSFSYGGDCVLDNASMEIKKGEFVALSGISGSGKSTIIRLLLSLVDPNGGKIYLQGNHNYPISASTRSIFGYVPQGNMLISGTIADNIAYYGSFSREDIEKAAKTAQMDFAFSLPEGLDTLLGEKGSGLSEGQIQRIAVARALVRNSPILLLDEATSALDEETEIKLLDALKNEKDKTVIIITHRKKVFDYCDKIINLSDGKLTEIM